MYIHSIFSHLSCDMYMYVLHYLQDGLRLLIQFTSHGEYELDANTPDEKNKV